ncbi:MAG: DUF3616 domain-containing protein [Microcoleaceae cyanobacterium]
MTTGYLLDRILLQFTELTLHQDLSAACLVGDQLWVASDETTSLECLTYLEHHRFCNHQSYSLADFFEGFNPEEGEADIEGLDFDGQYLWIVGSHSAKRKKAKGDEGDRLKKVEREGNRYLLARIPLVDGNLHQVSNQLSAACLKRSGHSNLLTEALMQDEWLAPFLTAGIPGKDNGLDVEGLAVYQDKILIGLRGPVLRGIAIFLEIEVELLESHSLGLKPLGKNGKLYKKHFVDLGGLGIRELCRDGEDLLILAGPSMDLDGALRVFRLHDGFDLPDNSLTNQEKGKLERLFDIPFGVGTDRAEGLTLCSAFGQVPAILVVYDIPDPTREVQPQSVLADIFSLL